MRPHMPSFARFGGGTRGPRRRVTCVTRKPLPPPEWWEEFRLLHVAYGRGLEAIRALDISEQEKRSRGMDLWLETEKHRKRLTKDAIPKLRCTARKADGTRCSKTARPDYFGQMCSSHAPHIEDYPSLDTVRARWSDHEYNFQGEN